jgi:hypothetical protein
MANALILGGALALTVAVVRVAPAAGPAAHRVAAPTDSRFALVAHDGGETLAEPTVAPHDDGTTRATTATTEGRTEP